MASTVCFPRKQPHGALPLLMVDKDWSKRGGIVGRGVLLDYASWAEKKGIQYNPMSRHQIFVKDLDEIAKDQGVELHPGDIMIVRSGWIKWYDAATPEDRYKHVTQGDEHIGLDGNAETIEWLWNHHFAAIAGGTFPLCALKAKTLYGLQLTLTNSDTIAFEAWPPKAPYREYHLLLLRMQDVLTKWAAQRSTTSASRSGASPLANSGTWRSCRSCARSTSDGASF